MKRILATTAASLTLLAGIAGPAAADHSSVVTPSGCHETNINGAPSDGRGQGDGGNGGGGWHNSAAGHERAVAVGAHQEGGC